jgi:zinc protease
MLSRLTNRQRTTIWGLLLTVLVSGALSTLAGADYEKTARWKAWPSSRMPKPLEARPVTFPPYEIRTLANGLKVVVVTQHEQPAVSLRMIVRAGAANDPQGRAGLANMVASLLDQGTATRSAGDVAEAIDYIGGALGAGAGTDLSFVNAIVMKDNFADGLTLLSDVARTPAFAPQEIERQRDQVVSALGVNAGDPEWVADAVIDRLIYGFHPYGLPGAGTATSVAAITRDDIVAFHQRWYAPNNAILAIVGDLSLDEAFAGAERVFGGWARRDVPAVRASEAPDATRRVIVVDRPGAVQTEIRVGNVAIPRKHADYEALDLAVKVLGGEGANRIQRVLRSERGLTYGASADIQALKQTGGIVAETDTRSETTGEALRLVVDEFFRLQREPVFELELADAQAYLTGNFPLTIETPDAIALQVLNVLFYDLDVKDLETYRARVNAIKSDDIQRVARGYLKPARLSIVLVGDARLIEPQLKSVGFGEFERVPIERLDLTAPNFLRPATAGGAH